MANIIQGMLYKKVLNPDGTVKENIPYLLKTLAKLVILEDGTNVQDSITELKNKSIKTFDTKADYDAALAAGEVGADEICAILNE